MMRLIAITLLAGVMFTWSGDAQWVNEQTHCDSDGDQCVTTCEDVDGSALQEDEPCWLITSPASDYDIPMHLRLFGAKDYR